ncbi:unnamed protein product, partial [Musa hybrid cultivar]
AADDAPGKNPAAGNRLAVRVIPRPLSADGEIASALRHLRATDPILARIIDAHDSPTFQCLLTPFHSLARSILYQQLAIKAAASIYARFLALCGGEAGLRQIGVSERKASYLHDLARKYHGGILSDATIVAMDDKSLFSMLTMVKGIGAWSVHMFMMFCLHRPDVLPVGDLGVRKGCSCLICVYFQKKLLICKLTAIIKLVTLISNIYNNILKQGKIRCQTYIQANKNHERSIDEGAMGVQRSSVTLHRTCIATKHVAFSVSQRVDSSGTPPPPHGMGSPTASALSHLLCRAACPSPHHTEKSIGIPASSSSSSGYKPSLVRGGSAFSKPTLFPSTSLVSPRGEGDAGGAGVGSGCVGRGGARNGNILGNTEALPPPTLESTPRAIDRLPQSLGKNADQAAISNSSPGAAAYISTKYKECLRNHAAALGGHVVDGCGEFMPSGGPDTPEELKCAACGCHRSFHRRETDGSAGTANSYYHGTTRLPLLLPPPHPQANPYHQQQFQLGGFSSSPSAAVRGTSGFVHFGGSNPSGSGGTTTESSSEERLNTATPTPTTIPRKRFRTKFTAEQKENMLAFAERVGWRFQRQDDAMVEQFCAEIGVRR